MKVAIKRLRTQKVAIAGKVCNRVNISQQVHAVYVTSSRYYRPHSQRRRAYNGRDMQPNNFEEERGADNCRGTAGPERVPAGTTNLTTSASERPMVMPSGCVVLANTGYETDYQE